LHIGLGTLHPQVLQRDPRNRDRDDQKVQAPLQNNLVSNEEGEDEETDPKIHCLGESSSSPHVTQSLYEESLMDSQLNELSKGEKINDNPNRYNLRSKKKEGKNDTFDQRTKTKISAKPMAAGNKEKDGKIPQALVKNPTP